MASPKTVAEVLADPALAGLLSNEGPIPNPRYPTNALPQPALNSATSKRTNGSGSIGPVENPEFNESIASFTFAPEVKVRVNAPGAILLCGWEEGSAHLLRLAQWQHHRPNRRQSRAARR